MTSPETAFDQFWLLVFGVLRLDSETFRLINNHLPLSLVASIVVVLLAALSQGIGQSVVLFINRVKPLRFILSLAIAAIIFTFNYNFWILSTWLVANQIFQVSLSLVEVIQTLGFSYVPLLFGFLMVIPYFGMPIFVTLSIWTLLAIVTGIEAIADLSFWQVFECCILGWLVLQISQRTIGLITDLLRISLLAFTFAGLLAPFEALGWWAGWYGKDQSSQEINLFEPEVIGTPPLKGGAVLRSLLKSGNPPNATSRCDDPNSWVATYRTQPKQALPSTANHYIVYLDGIGKSSFEDSRLVENLLEKLSASLPEDRVLIRDIIPYSVINLPLTIDRPLANFWQWINWTLGKKKKIITEIQIEQ